jgi:hypothetical protein
MKRNPNQSDQTSENIDDKQLAFMDGGERILNRAKEVARSIEDRVRQITGNDVPRSDKAGSQ